MNKKQNNFNFETGHSMEEFLCVGKIYENKHSIPDFGDGGYRLSRIFWMIALVELSCLSS